MGKPPENTFLTLYFWYVIIIWLIKGDNMELSDYIQYILLFAILLLSLYFLVTYFSKLYTRKKIVNVLREASELQKTGDINGAIGILEENLKNFSFSDPVFSSYISFLIANGRYEKGKGILQEMTGNKQEEFASVNMLGYISTIEEKFDDAELYYKKALALDPTKKKAIYTNLAVIYAEQGKNLEEAVSMLSEVLAVEDGSNKYPVYVNLGYTYYKLQDYEKAVINEKIGLELIPKGETFDSIRAFAHYILGLAHMHEGRKGEAKADLLIAQQLVKNSKFREKIQKGLNELS